MLVLAGSETTASLLAGVTYLLCKHPDVMAKVTREVRSTFESPDQITIASVNSLSYMLVVLNEALRCYPPSTSMLVRAVPAGGLEIAGRFVPEGVGQPPPPAADISLTFSPQTLVEIQQWSMNHSKDNWENPWEFRPDRFAKGLGEGDKQKSLQPFNVGPRDCIGRKWVQNLKSLLGAFQFLADMPIAVSPSSR